MSLICVNNLHKDFRVYAHKRGLVGSMLNLFSAEHRTVRAVDGISFEIKSGEFVGYVGPNGAGKSTTIKMLTGILVPSSGEVEVNGLVPHQNRKRNALHIGVVFGQRTQLWWDLPPIEAFRLLGKMYRIEPERYQRNLDQFTKLFELGPLLDTPVRKLSLGERMRCELTAALLHDPKVLFLDEPTIGLDVVAKEHVRNLLATINAERGTTIMLTSHDLDDIERLCGRVIVIDKGRVIHDGTVQSLKGAFGNFRRLVVDFAEPVTPALPEGAAITRTEGKRVWIDFDADTIRVPDLMTRILASHQIHDLQIQEADIEETIKRIYAGK